jgi:hypothetical protein
MPRAHLNNFSRNDKCFVVAGNCEEDASSREVEGILEALEGGG